MKTLTAIMLLGFCATSRAATLTVDISNLSNPDSKVNCGLFKSKSGFPMETSKASAKVAAEVKNGTAVCEFKDVPPGKIAISVMEDVNGNGKMDTGTMGIPKEPWGVSKNAPMQRFGPPKFSDAAIEVKDDMKIEIKLVQIEKSSKGKGAIAKPIEN